MSLLRRSLPRLLYCAVLVVLQPAHAITPQDLKWDLSYRSARAAHAMDGQEFMQHWPTPDLKRPVFDKLAAYDGPPIEASLLIEAMDGHAGDPSATWVIKTRDGAEVCSFHPKSLDKPCTSVDPAAALAAIRAVAAMRPLPPLFDTPERRRAQGEAAGRPGTNYIGFLSLYLDGESRQRPVNILEYMQTGETPAGIAEQDIARLQRTLARLVLAPDAFQKQEQQRARQERHGAWIKYLRAGDIERVRAMLDDDGHPVQLAGSVATAAPSGNRALIDLLLARGAAIDEGESDALVAAVQAKDAAMIAHLIERGARPDPVSRNPSGRPIRSALTEAARSGQPELARLLLRRGADPNLEQVAKPLPAAAYALDLPMVDLLLEAGARVDQVADDKSALVLLAGAFADDARAANPALEAILRRLVQAGANPNFTMPGCQSALSLAHARAPDGRMVRLLKSLGADPEATARCEARIRQAVANATGSTEARARAGVAGPVASMLQAGDVDGLERLYRRLLASGERTPSGVWKLAVLYGELRVRAGASRDQDYFGALLRTGAAWQAKYPASPAARLLQVMTLRARAGALAGSANGAALEQRLLRGVSMGAARDMLAEAKPLAKAARDPEWHRTALMLMEDEEAPSPAEVRALLAEAKAAYPGYHEAYFQAAYLALFKPGYGLDPVQAIAREAGRRGDADQPMLYARVLWAAHAMEYAPDPFGEGKAEWPLARASFEALVARYPDPLNVNAYAYFACLAGDHATSARLLERLGDALDFAAWGQQGRQAYGRCALQAAERRTVRRMP